MAYSIRAGTGLGRSKYVGWNWVGLIRAIPYPCLARKKILGFDPSLSPKFFQNIRLESKPELGPARTEASPRSSKPKKVLGIGCGRRSRKKKIRARKGRPVSCVNAEAGEGDRSWGGCEVARGQRGCQVHAPRSGKEIGSKKGYRVVPQGGGAGALGVCTEAGE